MFNHFYSITKRRDELIQEIDRLKKKRVRFPKGEISCTKNGKNYKWFYSKDKNRVYLPKTERKLAESLAEKRYYFTKLKVMVDELEACNAYLKKCQKGKCEDAEEMLVHPEYSKLLKGKYASLNTNLLNWMNSAYLKNVDFPEDLTIKATQGKMVRSKSEADIDKMLFLAGIPFHYEERLVIGNQVMYPDFTIRHPITGKVYYWEHCGRMDDEKYVENHVKKIATYCKGGIYPGDQLILTYETKKNPFSIEKAERVIKELLEEV